MTVIPFDLDIDARGKCGAFLKIQLVANRRRSGIHG
ncbi:MAG: hypothetical protein ACI91F_003623, partial [Candidatus Binatia bacterium]